jgi:hypothetical protein
MLTAEEILKAEDKSLVLLSVPEWGGDLYVRVMSGGERDKWELDTQKVMSDGDNTLIRATLCAKCICDDKGNRLFTDKQIKALSQKSSAPLMRVFEVARKLNKLTDEDLEELEKNLLGGPPAVSGSN